MDKMTHISNHDRGCNFDIPRDGNQCGAEEGYPEKESGHPGDEYEYATWKHQDNKGNGGIY